MAKSDSINFANCGLACFENKQCNYFVYKPKTLTCHLKKSDSIKTISSPGNYCGFINNRGTPGRDYQISTDGSIMWDNACDFNGNDRFPSTSKSMPTHTECGQACKADLSCIYFTFNRATSTCYTKEATTIFNHSNKSPSVTVCGFILEREPYTQKLLQYVPIE